MDFVEVTAHFSQDGEITPLSFTWLGRDYVVESTGRSWKDDEGGHHVLVMVPGARIFELVLDAASGRWRLEQVGSERQTA